MDTLRISFSSEVTAILLFEYFVILKNTKIEENLQQKLKNSWEKFSENEKNLRALLENLNCDKIHL